MFRVTAVGDSLLPMVEVFRFRYTAFKAAKSALKVYPVVQIEGLTEVGETQQIGDAIDKAIKEGEDETKD